MKVWKRSRKLRLTRGRISRPAGPRLLVPSSRSLWKEKHENKQTRVNKHDPSSPSLARRPGKDLPRVSGCRRDGEMASAEWIHRQGTSDGCEDGRHLQNVVHEFNHRKEPFFRRDLSRAQAASAHSLQ